jgi:hypothetical protein
MAVDVAADITGHGSMAGGNWRNYWSNPAAYAFERT